MSYGHWSLGNWQTGALPWRNWQTGVTNYARNRQPGATSSARNWQVRAEPMWNWQTRMAPPGNWQTGVAPRANWHTGPAPSWNRQTQVARGVGNWQNGMATMGNWRTGVTDGIGHWQTGLAPGGNWHIGPNYSPWDWQTGLLTAEGNWHTGPNYGAWNWQTGLDYGAFFPWSLAFPAAWDASGAAQDPWRPLEESMPRILTGPKCSLQATLEFPDQWHMQMPAHEEQSRLTRAEQRAALEKLKKEIYKPLLKRNGNNVGEDIHEKEKEKDQDTETCVICLEDFKPEEEVMLTPCNHMFHEDCIVPWVKSHGQCPICRLQFVRLLLNRN
ncbi:uncharacterized protein LOC117927181 isoform X2 [Vitis riparia]|uniref:uncharacterized protein LOC117927181 isoform X2 n=1 Tax=Vitis riparia TaxID=96939 RepID=UPI00155A49A4|nr:uncharacterized protein LOC117927181 isoform X2 [Vitis riparia]